jgi:K+/H+ antiporter YhaU regulatory subunit KhtT
MVELEIKDQLAELMAVMREQTAKLDNISVEMGATTSKVASLEEIKPALVDLALWKPKVDQAVVALQSDLGDLRLSIDKLVHAASSSSRTLLHL